MELILLSLFGIASLFGLEFFGLFYQRWVTEPHLADSELHAAPPANQADSPTVSQFPKCLDAANDAYTTTIVRVRARGSSAAQQENEHV